jgi:GntR family transcriptional regulator
VARRLDAIPAGAQPLRRNSSDTLWVQLANDLRRRIDEAQFNDGFPTEVELAAAYEVSRYTVREALRRLRDDGLVDSKRGRGTTVIEPSFHQPLGALYSLFRLVEAQGVQQRSQVRRLELTKDSTVALRLGLPESSQLLYLERLRLADGDPLAWDRAWVPASLGSALLRADFSHAALYDRMAEVCGLRPDSGREEIRAVVPSPAERDLLQLRPGTGAFRIERLGYAGPRPVEWRSTLIRSDRYSFSVDWLGSSGIRLGARHRSPAHPVPN